MSKDSFKNFARIHPELATSVLNGKASWQQLYEIYEIYGENNNIWNNFIKNNEMDISSSFKDLLNTIKGLDMDSVQKGINNIQKAIGLIQDIGINKSEREPIYKRFDN